VSMRRFIASVRAISSNSSATHCFIARFGSPYSSPCERSSSAPVCFGSSAASSRGPGRRCEQRAQHARRRRLAHTVGSRKP
jgi:hypothetical protein